VTVDLKLTRLRDDGKRTTGKLFAGELVLHTMERPWLNNDPANDGDDLISCVPPGQYLLVPHASAKFGQTWALVNHKLQVVHQPADIPPKAEGNWRAAILIHTGNWVRDVIGCIAVGLGANHPAKDEPMVTQSRQAMAQLRELLGPMTRGHQLTIEGPPK
jgi:hypothetical protein